MNTVNINHIIQQNTQQSIPSFQNIQNIVPIFIKITEHELSPLFSTLSNRLSRLHSLFSKDQIKELFDVKEIKQNEIILKKKLFNYKRDS